MSGGNCPGGNVRIPFLSNVNISVFYQCSHPPPCIGGKEDCWKRLPNEARRAENRGRRPRVGEVGFLGKGSKPHQLGGLAVT